MKVAISSLATLFAVSMAFSAQVQAEETTSQNKTTVKTEDVKPKKKSDLDNEVTNAKMRAESGSKSTWSSSATIAYGGGQFDKPFDDVRPNVTNEPEAQRVSMGGSMSVRRRINKNLSATAGTGFSVIKPLHGAEDWEMSTPFMSLNRTFKRWGIQQATSGSMSMATAKPERDFGNQTYLNASHTFLFGSVMQTPLTMGISMAAAYTLYDKRRDQVKVDERPDGSAVTTAAENKQQDYSVAAYPFVEYTLSDKYSIRSVFRPYIYSHARTADGWTFAKRPWSQTIGLSTAITRDIFMYPYIAFQPERISKGYDEFKKYSTVNIYTTFNVF